MKDFLRQVKAALNSLDEAALREFILKYAKTLPEKDQDSFLKELGKDDLIEDLIEIDDGLYAIEEAYNDDFDDDDPDSNAFLYYPDPFITEKLKKTEREIKSLIEKGAYKKALELFYALAGTHFKVEGISSRKLEYRELEAFLPDISSSELVIPLVYAAYQEKSGVERITTIIRILELTSSENFSFQELLDYREELTGFEDFLQESTDYLKDKNSPVEIKFKRELLRLSSKYT